MKSSNHLGQSIALGVLFMVMSLSLVGLMAMQPGGL